MFKTDNRNIVAFIYGHRGLERCYLLLRADRLSPYFQCHILFDDLCVTLPHPAKFEMPSIQEESVAMEKEHLQRQHTATNRIKQAETQVSHTWTTDVANENLQ